MRTQFGGKRLHSGADILDVLSGRLVDNRIVQPHRHHAQLAGACRVDICQKEQGLVIAQRRVNGIVVQKVASIVQDRLALPDGDPLKQMR